jgi:hypothetical protein
MFDQALQRFIDGVNAVKKNHDMNYGVYNELIRVRTEGVKYIALDRIRFDGDDVDMTGEGKATSIYCFVASEDCYTKFLGHVKCGDVLKAASYKKPAKHARGNIFDDDNGLKNVGPYGPAYL